MSKAEAETVRAAIVTAHTRNERYASAASQPVMLLLDAETQYLQWTFNSGRSASTVRWRRAALHRFRQHVGEGVPVTVLSARRLSEYFGALGIKSARRYVEEVEAFWRWCAKRKIPGVPEPEVISDELVVPPPAFSSDAPSWKDVDAMMEQFRRPWHRRVALVLRYTGIRASQALTLSRSDIHLDRRFLVLRADTRGAKGAKRHRAIPLHEALVDEMLTWNLPAEGLIFTSTDRRRSEDKRKGGATGWREDALCAPFTRAWKVAGVDERKWGAPKTVTGGRDHARPVHAIRACVATELRRAGAQEAIVDLIIGHSTAATRGAYVPEASPETSPYWNPMLVAVGGIPRHASVPIADPASLIASLAPE